MLLATLFAIGTWLRLRDVTTSAAEPTQQTELPPALVSISAPSIQTASEATERQERYRAALRAARADLTSTPPESAGETRAIPEPAIPPAAAQGATAKRPEGPRPAEPATKSREKSRETARMRSETIADPESDLEPPLLLSAAFAPAEINDGEQTVLTVTIVDNLSGVRSVTGLVSSPAGSIHGFSARREGTTDSYLASVRVPKNAAAGVWHVRHLTLVDKVGNSTTLRYAQGGLPPTASFKVSSENSDTKKPTLKAAWLDRPAMRGGERNVLYVQADDEGTGLAAVSGVFLSPAGMARLGIGCQAGADVIWKCEVAPPVCLDCGAWRLEQIQLRDKANNVVTMRSSDPVVGSVILDITADFCDALPPVLSVLVLEPRVVSNAEGGLIRLQATAHDVGCGLGSMSGSAASSAAARGQRIPFAMQLSADGRTFTGRIVVPKHAAKGEWGVEWVQMFDKGYNLRTTSMPDPALSGATFNVE